MRGIPALAVLAVSGAALVGCGSAKLGNSGPITVVGTTTIATAETGSLVTCKGGPGAGVPPAGQSVAGIADPVPGASGGEIRLERRQDGSLVAICRR